MKKASRFFMGIFLCLTIVMLCVGCQGGGDGEGSTGSNGHTTISAASRYTTTSAASADADITPYASFKDDTYYYYMFYLGYVDDVPLQTDYAYYRYSGNSYTHSFTSTSTTSQSVEESCAYTASKTATWDNKIEVKVGHKAEFKAKFFKIAEAKHETSVQVGYSHNWGGSDTKSWTDTYTKAEAYSTSYSDTIAYEFDSNSKEGYYRFIMFGVVDVYALIVLDPVEKTFYREDITSVYGYGYNLDYSPSAKFDDNTFTEFDFDPNIVYTLGEPVMHCDDWKEDSSNPETVKQETNFVFLRSAQIKVTDAGRFSQPYDLVNFKDSFDIDLDAIKASGFTRIDFKIKLNVKEGDDGYQYIFLYKTISKSENALDSIKFEHASGRKDTSYWLHSEAELYFNNISIDRFADSFVLRYGASGNGNDTWYNKELQLKLIFKK